VTVDVEVCPLGVSPVDIIGADGIVGAEGGFGVVGGALAELAQDSKNIENARHGRAVIASANSHIWPTRVQSAEGRLHDHASPIQYYPLVTGGPSIRALYDQAFTFRERATLD